MYFYLSPIKIHRVSISVHPWYCGFVLFWLMKNKPQRFGKYNQLNRDDDEEYTDHIFKSVAWGQCVVSLPTNWNLLWDAVMLRYMQHVQITHSRSMQQQLSGIKYSLSFHLSTETRFCCTSLTSGPVYTGFGGVKISAEGRLLASASNGSTTGACACSTTQHTRASSRLFNTNSTGFSYFLPLWFLQLQQEEPPPAPITQIQNQYKVHSLAPTHNTALA